MRRQKIWMVASENIQLGKQQKLPASELHPLPHQAEAAMTPADAAAIRSLMPCPFCGGYAETVYIRDGRRARCVKCGAEGPPKFHGPTSIPSADARAIAAWNARAAEATLTTDIRQALATRAAEIQRERMKR